MCKKIAVLGISIVALTMGLAAQTTVTTSGTTSTGTVPVFGPSSNTTVTNSPIAISGSNVGIGTTAPNGALDVKLGTNQHINFIPNVNGGLSGVPGILSINDANTAYTPMGFYASQYYFGDGKVGIGNTSPAYLLDVAGQIRSSSGGIVFPDGSVQTTAYSQQGTFQVGNGSTSAVQALYVDSNLNGNTVSAPTQGVWLEWNNSSGMTDFINNEGGGTGGWQFINTNISGTPLGTPLVIEGAGNVGIGTTSPGAKLEVDGNVKLTANSGASITFQDGTLQSTAYTGVICGGDYAESVDVTGDRTKYEPGDVLVIDPDTPGKFLKSAERYSTSVTGIYSTKPGVVGRRQTTPKSPDEVPMAMIGIVPTKVSTDNGPIRPGDLLVTSSILGYAMKGTDHSRMLGAVIGKALGSLKSGTGVIEVLVTLQ